jgi:hypothetical protein
MGTAPGAQNIFAPMANTIIGTRSIAARGNIQTPLLRVPLRSIAAPGTNLYWSVQSIDTSFAGSPFAPEAAFLVRPFFTSWSGLLDGSFQAEFDTHSGTNYTIQASTNLVNWFDLFNFTPGSNGPFPFTDLGATNYNLRFYRFGQH